MIRVQTVDIDDRDNDSEAAGTDIRLGEFYPSLLVSTSHNVRTTVNHVTLAIQLKNGVESKTFDTQVPTIAKYFELTTTWCILLTDVMFLQHAWLNEQFDPMKAYQPKVLGFQRSFKGLKKPTNELVVYFCKSKLPYKVENCIQMQRILKFFDGNNINYAYLKALDDNYAGQNDIVDVSVKYELSYVFQELCFFSTVFCATYLSLTNQMH